MTLEYLIEELKKIHAIHPNADLYALMESPEAGDMKLDVMSVRYDNLSKSAVIEI